MELSYFDTSELEKAIFNTHLYLENGRMNKIECYLAVQGNKKPDEYVQIAKLAEENKFDRIYVYDDLFYHPSFPVLVTMAQHTSTIKLGACLLNGFYRHPAIIASNYAYLDELSGNRAILGLGRGAFFDLLGLETDEEFTRKGYEETIQLVQHLIQQKTESFDGVHFKTSANSGLKIRVPQKPHILTATWNYNMAYIAGKNGHELQVAEVWNERYLNELYSAFIEGTKENLDKGPYRFSIGGMICVGKSESDALKRAKQTVAVYLPYLQTILKSHGINPESDEIKRISYLSKNGKIEEATDLISNEMTRALSLVGTPEQIAGKINGLRVKLPITGILFSPPYGTSENIIENIEFLSNELLPRLD